MRPFSRNEMQRRARNFREAMTKNAVDAVILTSFPSIFYYGECPIHAFGRPAALLFPSESDPCLVAAILERKHIELQTWIQDRRYYSDHNIDNDYDHPQPPLTSMVQLLVDAVAQRGLSRSRIGVEDGSLPVAHYESLRSALPDAQLSPASFWLDRLRMVLSDEELEILRAADAIAQVGQQFLLESLRVGSRGADLVEVCRVEMVRTAIEKHPDKPYILHPQVGLDDPGQLAGHSEWATSCEGRVAEKGMVLDTVFDCFLWGYWGNTERTICVGKPSGKVLKGMETMVEAHEAAISAVRPGVRVSDVDRASKDVFEKNGYERSHYGSGCGRSVVSYENNSRFLPLDVRLYNDVVLEPGMAFSVEPMLGYYEAPFRHCNTIIVTENGCEVDSTLPRGVLWVDA
jgi:Xaa-Pro aminopeptidase